MSSSVCQAKIPSECPHHGVVAMKHKVELLFTERKTRTFDGDYLNDSYGVGKNSSAYSGYAQKLYDRLTSPQRGVVLSYVHNAYKTINLWLSQGEDVNSLPSYQAETIRGLNSLFDEYGADVVPEVLYRGVRGRTALAHVGTMRAGKKVTMHSYMSTSSDPLVVSQFTKKATPVILEIRNHKKALPISFKDHPHNNENEFLLPRETEYRVVKVRKNVNWVFSHPANQGYSLSNVMLVELEALN